MAGVALLLETDNLCDGGCDNGGCDNAHNDGRFGTMWSKASTVATATGAVARQGADAAKGHLEVVRPIMREKASKAIVVAGTAARQGMEAATEGLDVVRQTAPVVREKVSCAAVAAGSVARHHVEVAKDQLDSVRQSRPAMRGKAVAKQRLEVAKGHFEVIRHSDPVIRVKASARHGVDAAKEHVDAAKDFLVSVGYPGLAPGQSVNACNPRQDVDDSGRLIAMAFARHHLVGMEAENSEAAAEFLRSQRRPTTVAGAARSRAKASFKKVRSSLRSTKRRMTTFIKRAASHKDAQKQRAAQRAAANASCSQRLMRSDLLDTSTTETETAAPPDVFELFSTEELAMQQALTESMESAEWGATPDGRQTATADFFPVETASVNPFESDLLAPEVEVASVVPAEPDVLAPEVEAASVVPVESDVLAPEVATASVVPSESDALAPEVGYEPIVSRAWFLQPSAGTWLLPAPQTFQDTSTTPKVTPLLDDVVGAEPSVEVLSTPEVLASKIATPTASSLVQLRSCGGA